MGGSEKFGERRCHEGWILGRLAASIEKKNKAEEEGRSWEMGKIGVSKIRERRIFSKEKKWKEVRKKEDGRKEVVFFLAWHASLFFFCLFSCFFEMIPHKT